MSDATVYMRLLTSDHVFYLLEWRAQFQVPAPGAPPTALPWISIPYAIEADTMEVWRDFQVQGFLLAKAQAQDAQVLERLLKLREADQRAEREALANRRRGIIVPGAADAAKIIDMRAKEEVH